MHDEEAPARAKDDVAGEEVGAVEAVDEEGDVGDEEEGG